MKILVLIPSQDYRNQAGARIRYGRIATHIAGAGHELRLENIDAFDPLAADCDVMIISKCHDARALLCAAAAAQRGIKVGIDLFDDYFSQRHDSRLSRMRGWFDQMLRFCSFVLCSTPAIATVAHRYRMDLPAHVMNDPAGEAPPTDIAARLAGKLAAARETGQLQLCWFGIAGNPHFPVGLHDLAVHGRSLGALADAGFAVTLRILTNVKAVDAATLARLMALPVTIEIEAWSEKRETAALQESIACFLPVNAQNFSIAKSLNRAITALGNGCQVISAGYPLYAPLGALIYRDVGAFAADIEQGALALSGGSLDRYGETIAQHASAETEAGNFLAFLQALPETPPMRREGFAPIAVIHGVASPTAAHDLAHRLDGLSVGTPLSAAKLAYDVIFDQGGASDSLTMLVAGKVFPRLTPEAKAMAHPTTVNGRSFWRIGADTAGQPADPARIPLTVQIAAYAGVVAQIRLQMEEAFGPLCCILSETSGMPFTTGPQWQASRQAAA